MNNVCRKNEMKGPRNEVERDGNQHGALVQKGCNLHTRKSAQQLSRAVWTKTKPRAASKVELHETYVWFVCDALRT
jgi:hypothetical protein